MGPTFVAPTRDDFGPISIHYHIFADMEPIGHALIAFLEAFGINKL